MAKACKTNVSYNRYSVIVCHDVLILVRPKANSSSTSLKNGTERDSIEETDSEPPLSGFRINPPGLESGLDSLPKESSDYFKRQSRKAADRMNLTSVGEVDDQTLGNVLHEDNVLNGNAAPINTTPLAPRPQALPLRNNSEFTVNIKEQNN